VILLGRKKETRVKQVTASKKKFKKKKKKNEKRCAKAGRNQTLQNTDIGNPGRNRSTI